MEQGLTIEEVDALDGRAARLAEGRGSFRLGDLVGVDVLAHVATNFSRRRLSVSTTSGQEVTLAPFIATMLEKKWLGDKVGQGFYKKAGKRSGGARSAACAGLADAWTTSRVRGRSFRHLRWQSLWNQTAARIKQLLHARSGEG